MSNEIISIVITSIVYWKFKTEIKQEVLTVKLKTLKTHMQNKPAQINVLTCERDMEWSIKRYLGKNRRDNQEWTIQRHWQHRAHKTQNRDKDKKNTDPNGGMGSC